MELIYHIFFLGGGKEGYRICQLAPLHLTKERKRSPEKWKESDPNQTAVTEIRHRFDLVKLL